MLKIQILLHSCDARRESQIQIKCYPLLRYTIHVSGTLTYIVMLIFTKKIAAL